MRGVIRAGAFTTANFALGAKSTAHHSSAVEKFNCGGFGFATSGASFTGNFLRGKRVGVIMGLHQKFTSSGVIAAGCRKHRRGFTLLVTLL